MPSTGIEMLALDRAKLLLGCYRRTDANDPETYIAAIAAVLSLYDAALIRDATDPRTGIQTSAKHAAWPPNVGELKAFCDDEAGHRSRMKKYADQPRPNFRIASLPAPEPRPGRRANLLVPKDNPRYPEMCERAKNGDPANWKWHERGIMVSLAWWQNTDGQFANVVDKLRDKLAIGKSMGSTRDEPEEEG
jgi:hypothetical protein